MSLVNRRTREEVETARAEEAANEALRNMTTAEKFEALREDMRNRIQPGMQTYEVQDLLQDLCTQLTELEDAVKP